MTLPKDTSLSLRINKELKEKLSNIAKEKDISLNELSSDAISLFVNNHEIERAKTSKIPTAQEAKQILDQKRQKKIDESINVANAELLGMIERGENHTIIRSNDNQYIAEAISEHFQKLGYFTYIFVADCINMGEFSFYKFDVGVAIYKKTVSLFVEEDAKYF